MSCPFKLEVRLVLRFALALAAGAGGLDLTAAKAAAPARFTPARIAVLGDSFSERGWPNLLVGDPHYPGAAGGSNTLDHIWPGCVLSNFAVGGAHASGWLGIQTNAQGKYAGNGARMFLTNWPALLAFKPDLTVVFIGGNDFNEGRQVSVQTITNRIALLIDRLRERNSNMRIVLASYHDPYDGLSKNVVATDRVTNVSPAIKLFCDAEETLAQQKGCDSVCRTICDSFMNHCWGRDVGGTVHLEPTYSRPYQPPRADLHPGPAGHEALADIFCAKFRQMAGGSAASAASPASSPASDSAPRQSSRPDAVNQSPSNPGSPETDVPMGPYKVLTREVKLGENGEYRLYEPESAKPTCADIWVNGGKVSGYKVYDFRHRILASWGITVMASATDPVMAKTNGLVRGLHAPAIEYLKTNGYDTFSLSGHSGGAGSAVITSRSYDVKAITVWGGGGKPGKKVALLILTGTKDANPQASFDLYDMTEGPAFLGSYIDANHVATETVLGWNPKSPYHAGTVQFMRLTLAWLQFQLQGKPGELFKSLDHTHWDTIKHKNF